MRRFSGALSDNPAKRINRSSVSPNGYISRQNLRADRKSPFGAFPRQGRQTLGNISSLCAFCAGVFLLFDQKGKRLLPLPFSFYSNRFFLLWIYTLSTMPTQRYSISILVPPPEKKGRVTPITGRRDRFIPRLMTTCQAMAANTPAQI